MSQTNGQHPSQAGRTIIVTGANSGLGLETTKALAARGARVVMAVRDEHRGAEAAAAVPGTIEVRRLDLADLSSVRAFAAEQSGPFDVLVNNAGVMNVPEGRTRDGFETQFGTNHLGHFALTLLLLPRITDRVVTVSSGLHRRGKIALDDLNWHTRPYRGWPAYGQSKLGNLLFTLELQRRLTAAGSPVRALAAHPGYAATNLQSHSGKVWANRFSKVANLVFAQSAEMGALPSVYAATEDLPGESYVGPGGFSEMRGYPTLVGRSSEASDPVLARRLWEESERLTGVEWPLGVS